MTKKYIYALVAFLISVSSHGQTLSEQYKKNFNKKLSDFFSPQNPDNRSYTLDTVFYYPGLMPPNYSLSISNRPVYFDTIQQVLTNPYFSNNYDDSDKKEIYSKNFPKSFSVVYQNKLVALFENVKFGCFNIDDLERDLQFERLLNTKKFNQHWIIGDQLGALSGNDIYIWNGEKWIKSKTKFPLNNRPKLFEDDKFIVYRDCFGEWGGTVFFYEKQTGKTFFTKSNCTNSISKTKEGYRVVASLGHMMDRAEIKIIPDPTKLSLALSNQIPEQVKEKLFRYTDTSKAFRKVLDLREIGIFSSFSHLDRELYIVHARYFTFIAEIKDNDVKIVHPLFLNGLYTHEPVTANYKNCTLINLDYYEIGLKREVSLIIIKGKDIRKIDWNKPHQRSE